MRISNFVVVSFFIQILFSLSLFAQNNSDEPKSRVLSEGDYVLSQLVTPPKDFESLPLERKIYAYYISQAIDSGRDITWRQNSPEGLAIRNLFETIYSQKNLLSPSEKGFLEEYLFKLYGNHGNYDHYSSQKFILKGISFDRLLSISEKVEKKLKLSSQLSTEALRLKRELFDARFRKKMKTKQISKNAAQFYVGIQNKKDVEKLEKDFSSKLNSADSKSNPFLLTYPTVNENGEIVLELARIGGRFDKELRVIDYFLVKASEYATENEKKIIEAHRKTLYSGDFRDALNADRLWVQNKDGEFDFVLGFIENYNDPMGKRASWEGFLLLKKQDPETLTRIEAIRSNARYFESQMPVKEEYKKKGNFTPPQAEAAYIVYSGGDNGERPFAGVNLPNDDGIRETLGSKSYGSYNVMNRLSGNTLEKSDLTNTKKFYLSEYHEALEKVNFQLLHDLQVEFHEVLGHGSGRNMESVRETDLGKYYNPIEEGRAEVASLYHMTDPKLREFGILPKDMNDTDWKNFVEISIASFFESQLSSYTKLGESITEIRQAHQWARQMMLNWMLERGAISLVFSESGMPMVKVKDIDTARNALGALWFEIQDTKSRAESAALKEKAAGELLQKWGSYTDENRQWRKKIEAFNETLNLPKEKSIFLNPKFVVIEKNGAIEDVKLEYASSKTSQLGILVDRQIEMTKRFNAHCEKELLKKPSKIQ